MTVNGGQDKTFTYDENSNCEGYSSTGGNVTYEWDAKDRLVAVVQGASANTVYHKRAESKSFVSPLWPTRGDRGESLPLAGRGPMLFDSGVCISQSGVETCRWSSASTILNSDEIILLDFYSGAYGPTIRFDVPTRDLLGQVEAIFQALAYGHRQESRMHLLSFVRTLHLEELILRRDEKLESDFEKKTLTRDGKAAKFVWSRTATGWLECLERIEPLHAGPGHQYMTIEGLDDVLVELSYCETPPELRRRIAGD